MPIIPVLQPEGPDYTPPRMATLPAESQPAAQNARLAAGLTQLAGNAGEAAQGYMEVQGQIQAQKDRIKYTYDVENIKKQLLDAPLKPIPGSGATGEQGGEEGWQYDDLGFQPKWQTIEGDFKKKIDDLDQQYAKRQDPYTKKYFFPHQARIQAGAYRNIADERSKLFDNAQLSAAQQTFDDIHKRMFTAPAQEPSWSPDSTPSYKVAENAVYVSQKNLINDTANMLAARGMKSTVVEQMREKELRRLDADTAENAQHANPEVWLETIQAGTNEWQQKLDATHRDRLEDRARAAVNRVRANEDKELHRIKVNAQTELGQLLSDGKLDLPAITSRAKALQGETAPWLTHLKAQNDGDWNDNPGVVTPLRISALSFRPPADTQPKLDAALNSGSMSSKTHQMLSEQVTKSREREQKRADDATTREMGREHEATKAMLYPPVPILSDKPDVANNYADALQEINSRVRQEGEGASAKIHHEVRLKYLARSGPVIEAYQSSANDRLAVKLDIDKDGKVDNASVQAATKAAYQRHGLESPEKAAAAIRAGKFPSALDTELQLIDQVVQYGKLRTQNLEKLRSIKEGGKPQ